MKVTGSPAACQQPPMKQPTEPAPRIAIRGVGKSATATIGRNALVRQPQAFGWRPDCQKTSIGIPPRGYQ